MSDRLWQAKLAAWTHDPAEKALVLLRDPAGHEGGTVLKLRNKIFNSGKIPAGLGTLVKKADHWAAAADRPQFPQDPEKRFVGWAQVNFAHQPELIHPLSGTRFVKREVFRDIQPEHIKAVSLDHFDGLIQTSNGETDWRNTSLAFWRFGPETPSGEIGALWGLLPADTRIPDHTIWSHLDLSSAFATVFLADPQQMPALLAVSFGPVQGFIAQARSTSDLWAGSHLLSCIAWEGLKVICEELGPDCVLFPQLRGVPLVDLWLHQDCGMPLELFEDAKCEWLEGATDNNSLFSAALPNRFVALIPAARAGELGEKITKSVREWVKSEARAMLEMVLDAANQPVDPNAYCFEQLKRQLSEFPEVHWASVPWMCGRNEKASDGETRLLKTLHKFYPPGDGGKGKDRTETKPSYFGTTAWGLLSSAIDVQGARFFDPNPGVLYPAVYDMLERVAAAAKAVRPFTQLEQSGYRDTLTGEAEWLALDRAHLDLRPGQRKATLWARVSENKPAWARKGEHLSTLGMMKRVWPNRFVDLLKKNQFDGLDIRRYVVSTHTMALATSLDRFLEQEEKTQDQKDAIKEIEKEIEGLDAAVLPRDMMKNLRSADDMTRRFVRLVPTLLDKKRDNEASARGAGEEAEARRKRKDVETLIKKALSPDQSKPEAYYAFILMDGDRMGAWLAGNENEYQLAYGDIWHSSVKNAVDRFEDKSLKQYLIEKRHASPARHAAISESLNAFSLNLARHVVEDLFKGKLLYAGGDDVMAMVSVDDLLPAMLLLRLVYSGIATEREVAEKLGISHDMEIAKGFVRYGKRLYRVMGERATASAGAVVAHHSAPLGMVVRRLREAEQRAKNLGGRNAFALTIIKRSGGAVELTAPWFRDDRKPERLDENPMGILIRLRDAFASVGLSRRAAYLLQDWMRQLPAAQLFAQRPGEYQSMLARTLEYQLGRQSGEDKFTTSLGTALAALATSDRIAGMLDREKPRQPTDFISTFLAVSEFLAREGRTRTASREGRENRREEAVHA